jgi:hypothetical protein
MESKVSNEYIQFITYYMGKARNRELCFPINSDTPIPYRDIGILERFVRGLVRKLI